MHLKEFIDDVLQSEETCVNFLRKHGIFDEEVRYCTRGAGTRSECGGRMKRTLRKNRKGESRPTWRCTAYACQSFRSIRDTNGFFGWRGRDDKVHVSLSLRDIMMIVYLWLHTTSTIEQVREMTGHSKVTIVNWFHLCRQVCTDALERTPRMEGTEETPIKIDESYFSGRRKNRRGRKLAWDRASDAANGIIDDDVPLTLWPQAHGDEETTDNNWGGDVPPPDEDEPDPRPERNYGNRELGPWVVGLYQSKNNVRFKVVSDRKAATLIPLIDSQVTLGSIIMTDEWKGYLPLVTNGFVHYTVNHKKNFVDPHTQTHTQEIERQWVDAKAWMKRARGPGKMLQSHLDECAWRKLRALHPDGLLAAFLHDVFIMYDTNIP